MPMIRCSQGHFFDNQKHSSCPWCGVSNLDLDAARQTGMSGDQTPRTVALSGAPGHGHAEPQEEVKTLRLNEKAVNMGSSEGLTVSVVKKRAGIDPVVGWLVCVDGPDKGRDYRIHAEKNTAGRSDAMDIAIKGDGTISRDNHAYVVFNPKKGTFRVQPGEGRGLIYVNDEEVIGSQELKPYDIIEMGESKFCFVPFCGERFDWGGEKSGEAEK